MQGTFVRLMYQNVEHVSTLFNILCDCIMSRKQQTNNYLHKYLTESEWNVLRKPTGPYAEKLMTVLKAKERLGDMSKQGPRTKFIVNAVYRNACRIGICRPRLRRRWTNP